MGKRKRDAAFIYTGEDTDDEDEGDNKYEDGEDEVLDGDSSEVEDEKPLKSRSGKKGS